MKNRNAIALTVVAGLFTLSANATTYTATNAADLVSLLREHNSGNHVIELEPGDYILTEDSSWDTNSSVWASHLYLEKTRLRGLGEHPEDVRLIGSGAMRVVRTGSKSVLENLTITNGVAPLKAGFSNAGRGGGVYGGGTVTNCLVIGNRCASYGGGGAGGTVFRSCRLINNSSNTAGGAFHASTAYDCLFEGNTAVGDGGACYAAELYDCRLIGNASLGSDGSAHSGGAVYNGSIISNCLIVGNSAAQGGGVAGKAEEDAHFIDCIISNNYASAFGGATYRVTVRGGTVTCNRSATYGGLCGSDVRDCTISRNESFNGSGAGAASCTLSNCTVYANFCTNRVGTAYGAGIYASTAYDCRIFGNCAATCVGTEGKTRVGSAGGAHESTLYDCDVHDNFADSFAGGVRESTAVRCRIFNNCGLGDGPNAYSSDFIDCEVVGSGVIDGSALNTVFRDIGRVELKGNPYRPDFVMTNGYVWKSYPCATNCLFRDNMLKDDAKCQFFIGVAEAGREAAVVNCTFVSNRYSVIFGNLKAKDFPQRFVNCVFYGNHRTDGTSADISLYELTSASRCEPGTLYFDACAYGASAVSAGLENYIAPGGVLYQFGADGFGSSPRFCHDRDPENPYALRRSSPLVGKGRRMDWMDGATDIRGEGYARLRDDKVDIGCYQCWLDPEGMMLLFR